MRAHSPPSSGRRHPSMFLPKMEGDPPVPGLQQGASGGLSAAALGRPHDRGVALLRNRNSSRGHRAVPRKRVGGGGPAASGRGIDHPLDPVGGPFAEARPPRRLRSPPVINNLDEHARNSNASSCTPSDRVAAKGLVATSSKHHADDPFARGLGRPPCPAGAIAQSGTAPEHTAAGLGADGACRHCRAARKDTAIATQPARQRHVLHRTRGAPRQRRRDRPSWHLRSPINIAESFLATP